MEKSEKEMDRGLRAARVGQAPAGVRDDRVLPSLLLLGLSVLLPSLCEEGMEREGEGGGRDDIEDGEGEDDKASAGGTRFILKEDSRESLGRERRARVELYDGKGTISHTVSPNE